MSSDVLGPEYKMTCSITYYKYGKKAPVVNDKDKGQEGLNVSSILAPYDDEF